MGSNEQIKEMAKVLNECCNDYDKNGRRLGNKCYGCEHWDDTNHLCCSYNTKEASALYNAGYRKYSDVAREIFGMMREDLRGFVDWDYLEKLIKIYEQKYTESGKDNEYV